MTEFERAKAAVRESLRGFDIDIDGCFVEIVHAVAAALGVPIGKAPADPGVLGVLPGDPGEPVRTEWREGDSKPRHLRPPQSDRKPW